MSFWLKVTLILAVVLFASVLMQLLSAAPQNFSVPELPIPQIALLTAALAGAQLAMFIENAR